MGFLSICHRNCSFAIHMDMVGQITDEGTSILHGLVRVREASVDDQQATVLSMMYVMSIPA